MTPQSKKINIGIITSQGGHLFQMCQIKGWWKNYSRFWVTNSGEDVTSLLKSEKVYSGYFPESRNIFNACKNFFLAWKILRHEKPDLLISCGAGIAPPFFLMGKLLGIYLIFIEPYDFILFPSLSGKLIAPFSNSYFVQHRRQLRFSKKAEYLGPLL
jgi:beta-1,4-N-acetylglucosaminyltransferase